MTRGALDGRDLTLEIAGEGGRPARELVLPLSRIEAKDADAQMFRKIGLLTPMTRPEIGEVMPGSAAERAGLRNGDLVRLVGTTPIVDGQQLREIIGLGRWRPAPHCRPGRLERGGPVAAHRCHARAARRTRGKIGRIGAYVGAPPAMVLVRQGVVDGVWRGVVRTWEVSALTVRMMGKMVIGEASLKESQRTAHDRRLRRQVRQPRLDAVHGVPGPDQREPGVLNLMPLPVLDGGHLMYYLWEGLTGKSVSDAWMERFQRGGVALLLVMMSIALFNDVTRLFG
jgi:regulator of sigma E protease